MEKTERKKCPICQHDGHSTPDAFCRAPEGCELKGENHVIHYPNFRGNGHPSQYDGGYCKKCGYKPYNIY